MGPAMCRRPPVLLLWALALYGCGGSQQERDDNGPLPSDGSHMMVRGSELHGTGGAIVAAGSGGAVVIGSGGAIVIGSGGAIVIGSGGGMGTGGRSGTGGRVGTGGAIVGTGGAIIGTGGAPGTGGVIGTGGHVGTGGAVVMGTGGAVVMGTGGADAGTVLPDCPPNRANTACKNRGALCAVVATATRRDSICFCGDDQVTWICPDLASGTLDACPRSAPLGGSCSPRDAVCQLSDTQFCFCDHDRAWVCAP